MINNSDLVRVTKYSNEIKELKVRRRVSVEYPLLCRNEVALLLADVAKSLPSHIHLQIDSAYRTKDTQKILWNSRKGVIPGLVYDPSQGLPPHCTGGAVDVSLVDANGNEINLSEPFLKYYDEPQLESAKISPKAQKLRFLLHTTMLVKGFAPHQKEYWHFSYGDKVWANYYNQDKKYDEISLTKTHYYPLYLRLYYKIARRLWKMIITVFSIQTNY